MRAHPSAPYRRRARTLYAVAAIFGSHFQSYEAVRKLQFFDCFLNLLLFLKRIFSDAAQRAYPIVGDVFPLCARRYAAVGIAFFRVVYVPAYGAFVFVHSYAPQIALYRIFVKFLQIALQYLYYTDIF